MQVKFYTHESLTDARKLYKSFACNMQSLNAADIFNILQNFPNSM